MNCPINANLPISPSFNVLGPHPLTYPQSYLEKDSDPFKNTKGIQTEAASYDNYSRGPSTSSSNKNKSLESLLAVVKNETGKYKIKTIQDL